MYFNDIGISATQLGIMGSIAKSLAIIVIPIWEWLQTIFSYQKGFADCSFCVLLTHLAYLTTDLFWPVFFIYILHVLCEAPLLH